MSLKFFIIFTILLFATMILVTEARGGRGRSGSFGSTFYRRSYKKSNNNPSGGSSRRKVVSGSPVHTVYTKPLISTDNIDVKLGKHSRGRHRSSHTHHTSHGSSTHHDNYNSHSSSHGNSHSLFGTQSHHQPHHQITHNNAHNYNLLGPRNSYHNSPHVSQNWGGHQLPPGHVHITQPSSIPTHAVYYAQPPIQSSVAHNSNDFALGYLIGSSHTRHHYHHDYDYQGHQDTSHHSYNEYAEDNTQTTASAETVSSTIAPTHYWPTDNEVSLAPLNNTLLPLEVTETNQTAIFKGPPKLSAEKLSIDNSTFELPETTAPPPDTPPANGIICMPWTFNETDPTNPTNIVSVEKTICFPAPPPPPTTTPAPSTPAPSTSPVAGDIGVDVVDTKDKCSGVICPSTIAAIDFGNINICCLGADRLQIMVDNIIQRGIGGLEDLSL